MAWVLSAVLASGPSDAALSVSGYQPVPPPGSGTIDGVLWSSVSVGQRVLLLNQGGSAGAAAASNGIWVYQGANPTPMTRPTGANDYVHATTLDPETTVRVSTGSTMAHTEWACVTTGAVTIDTTAISHSPQKTAFNVRDFGATGNGVTDDTAPIQAALNACARAGGGKVFFPPTSASYACSSALSVGLNTFVHGAAGTSSTLKFTGSGRGLQRVNSVNGSHADYCTIQDLNIVYTGTAPSTSVASGSNGASLPQTTINVTSTGGFSPTGSFTVQTSRGPQNITYTGLTATSFTGCNGVATSPASTLSSSGNNAVTSADGGIVNVCGAYFEVRRCVISGFGFGIILDQTVSAHLTENNLGTSIGGIWISDGTYSAGASSGYTSIVTIDNNQFNGSYCGIVDDGGITHIIRQNNFTGHRRVGIAPGTPAAANFGGSWTASHSYAFGAIITAGQYGLFYTCTTAGGGMSGASLPAFPNAGTVTDGAIVWTVGSPTYPGIGNYAATCGIYLAGTSQTIIEHNYFEEDVYGTPCVVLGTLSYATMLNAANNVSPGGNTLHAFRENFAEGSIGELSLVSAGPNPWTISANEFTTTYSAVCGSGNGYHMVAMGNSQNGVNSKMFDNTTTADQAFVADNGPGSTSGNLGVGLMCLNPQQTLDIQGGLALRTLSYAVGGATLHDVALTDAGGRVCSTVEFVGSPGANYSISGFAGGTDGLILDVTNLVSAWTMSLVNNGSGSSAGNRIITNTGANVTPTLGTAFSWARFRYSGSQAAWLLLSHS